jgi:hypothetical protein
MRAGFHEDFVMYETADGCKIVAKIDQRHP